MADIESHGFIERIRGRYGKIVVRNRYGKQFLARPPNPELRVDTPARAAVRLRFTEAADYAKAALADPVLAPLYEEVGKSDQIGGFAAAVRDYLRPPVISRIGLDRYKREMGRPITVVATDDAGVTGVAVALRSADGTELESGPCTRVMGKWTYVATTLPPADEPVTIVATATDYAGNTAEKTEVYP